MLPGLGKRTPNRKVDKLTSRRRDQLSNFFTDMTQVAWCPGSPPFSSTGSVLTMATIRGEWGKTTSKQGSQSRETATCLNISRQTVSKLWKQFQNDGTVVRRPGQGRKRMTTASEDRYLALTARRNRKATARQLSSELAAATGAVASRQTIYRRLNEKGLYARKPRSRFSLTGDSKRVYIWRESGTRNDPSNIVERDRFGSRGVMVWGDNDLDVRLYTCSEADL
ncbi:transposable element Tc1 transposase [Trichonephila clavipes]|nr:transposable element Tc1 transposase [Trichonephila clavipes]